ncbi:ankyrin-3 isoform X15 [Ischnura elegans]|uniref:ankyrin-3 isoform X15 n=1 Tax=Ischnura elegans TaxID=197161 RepID=UPI001ED89DAB|nr:ankyrin-3 isoform X15 [Ischnura elegans]
MPVEGDVVASRDGDEDEYPVPPTDGTGFEEEVMKKVSDLGTITQGLAPVVNGNADTLPRDAGKQADGNTAFLRAARAGNLDKVLEYLKSNIDINTSNANGLNALHLASKDGHVNVVTELLKRGATVDAATKKGNTALHIASLAGQEEVVKILVQNGASVNVQSQNGFTPLYMAAQENHDNVVRFLLANGANQSLATEDGFTPLAVAMQQGHDKVVTVLLENDTRGKVRLPALHIAAKKDDCKAAALLLQNDHNPDVTSKSGFTPLHIAAHYGNENIANLLLQRGADVNYSAKHNITPLHVAAKWGKTNMVSLLIEKGANIEAKTRDGLTPLHCAARSGHEQVVDMLLERGAPISSKTKNGLAPLHMASQGDHVDAARILLYHRAPVDEVTVDYLTALHVAAHCGHVRVAKLLLDRKADPNARALNGFTPLHIACKKNRIKVVELLLKHGASIEATTESGLTPLHVASFMGCMNIVIYLIQHEANPDVPTVRGETPLHLAARANQADIIRILLRNGAQVDARAREQQTPLHIASRLGNVDIVMLLLQHGAAVDATTKDMYTALHIAAKEGQEEVASVLLEHGASLTATTKKGFTPLHLAAKYGKMKVARLLLQRDAPVDAQGKNGVTPLHVASHYDHQNVALLLLDKGASPHATAKNGHTPLHIAARKNQMDIATTLLEYGAKANAESKAGFTPLHLSSQEGHTDMSTLLIEHQADPNHKAKNGLTPLHLCAQEDRVNVATILVKNGAEVDAKTKAGYTPLHVACHFGQINMVRFLLQHGVDVNSATSAGYTPLHQAAQQGHVLIINLLLESRASPNAVTNQGQTALSIAQKLGYISVVETLKVVTETVITTTTTITTEEKYRVMAPETMQETFMSDSEDEGGDDLLDSAVYGKPTHAQHVYLPYYEGQMLLTREDTMLSDQPYRYLTVDEMKSLGDDSLPIDVTRDERGDSNRDSMAPPTAMEDSISPQHSKEHYSQFSSSYAPDNVDIARHPVHVGKLQWKTFLVSFMVDARGGAMRGCRHSGVRVIVPPRKAAMPMRITCRYLKKDKLAHPPPLMEGEALASRILELGPVAAKFLGPVIIEVPHFGSLRGKEREIVILRSDNGETWREHTLEASEEAIQDVLNESFDGEELTQLEDLNTNRITRILTTDFPQYFAIVSRVRQEVHAIGPEGGMVSSTVVPQVQAVFPQGALTKKIKVGLQAQPISAELVAKLLGNRVAVSPIVTVEPRRRKFHKPITLTIPVPQAANKGMINQYSGDAPTLRLLCSITGVFRKRSLKGGTTRAQWEDVTGSTPLTFVNDCVSFTTTVSARFWLMDCRNIAEATKMATELYKEAIHVPFMAKFVVFAKRVDVLEARLRVFCMTDDKEDKTLEHQEHFTEVAKSRDVEVLEGKSQFVEFAGNLVPVTKSGDQLQLGFHAFKENRLPFTVRVKDPHADTVGRILFMREPKVAKGEPPQSPICILNIVLPETITPEMAPSEPDLLELEKKYSFLRDGSLSRTENIHKADLRLSDICNLLGLDWIQLANELGIAQDDIHLIQSEYPDSVPQQAMVMLRLWMQQSGNKATGNTLEKSLRKINREDIVDRCIFNVELVTDDMEKAVAKVRLDQSGFDNLKEELGPSRDTSLRRNVSLDVTYDEQDIMKESESVEELVAAEKIVTPKEDRLAHESEVEAKDSIREKDVGAEKIGDEVRKSIKDYEREEQKYVGEEKEYKEFEEALMKDAPKPVHEEITKKRGHEEVKEAAFVKDESKKSPTIMAGMADDSGDDKKRKADMIAEITEELGRLDTSYKGGAPMPVKEAVTSPKISKTPPPSPAEFKEGTVMSTKVTHEFPARDIVVGEEHTEYITPDGTTVRQTTITKTTIVQGAEPSITEEAAQLAESETWQSDDQSTHPEELSSVQEWAEKMQQKHSAGHGGPATEDAEKSPDGVCLTDFGEEGKFDGNFCKVEEKEKHPVIEQDGNVETYQNSVHSLASHVSIEKEHKNICDAAKPKDLESNFSLPTDHCAPLIDSHIISQEIAPQRYEMSEHLSFLPTLSTRRLIVDGEAMDVSSNFQSKPRDKNVDYGMEEEAQSVFSSLKKVEQSIQSLMEEQRSLSLSNIPSEIEEADDPFLVPVSSDRSKELDKLEAAVERMLSEIEMQDATDAQIPLNIPPANVAMEDNLKQTFRETDSNSLQSETTPSFNADHFHSLVKNSLYEYPGDMTGYEHEFNSRPKLQEEELRLLSSRGEKFITDTLIENDGMISGSRISQFSQPLSEGADVVKSQDMSRICEYGLGEASSGDLLPSKEINESKREEPRTVRAEVKLLVKTYDSGKEAIEIRSVREFVDTSRDQGGAFSGIFPLNFEGKTPQSQGSDLLKGTKIDYFANTQILDENAPNPPPEARAEVDSLQEKGESSVEERGETGGAEHMTQEDAPATYSTTMRAAAPRRRPPRPIHDISIDDDSDNVECDVREHDWRFDLQTHRAQSQKMGSEFYQTQDPESTSEYDPSQTTTQARVVTTRTLTRTVMGEDGRPVSVTTTETEVSDGGGAEGVLDSNQLRESMQQIIDQFASEEEMKEGKESKEEKKPE